MKAADFITIQLSTAGGVLRVLAVGRILIALHTDAAVIAGDVRRFLPTNIRQAAERGISVFDYVKIVFLILYFVLIRIWSP